MAEGVAGKTLNNRLAYLKAVYSTLRKLDVIDYECPFHQLQPIKLQERPLSFLSLEQIDELLKALDERETSPHPPMIARLCLATGARWGEAEAIGPDRLKGHAVVFANTKSKRVRVVPISASLAKSLKSHWAKHGQFTHCMETFRRVLNTTAIKLPDGQASHVLRHTFASHFVMRGGNILVLQRILGHSSLTMTMRYAHLAPDHLQEAVQLNPFDGSSTPVRGGK
ncbi:Tyrosine recombinase XerC [Pseudomonas carbonaria]|uniref:Tyrosine recombinase XerC n=2 Tax=Zestomonas carbonaria TaxID=2762745 RepID=A0A7U7IAN6_9GAMM|nr:Tyrosine recombinase XerC [Pseudomonas carbonaria]